MRYTELRTENSKKHKGFEYLSLTLSAKLSALRSPLHAVWSFISTDCFVPRNNQLFYRLNSLVRHSEDDLRSPKSLSFKLRAICFVALSMTCVFTWKHVNPDEA